MQKKMKVMINMGMSNIYIKKSRMSGIKHEMNQCPLIFIFCLNGIIFGYKGLNNFLYISNLR